MRVDPSWLAGGDGAHGAEGVTGGEGCLDEGEEAAGGVAGDDIEGDATRVQQETQTVCPFTETGFLPGERGRPKCCSTC